MEDELFNILYELADTVIEAKEVDEKKEYIEKVCETAKKYADAFLEQIKKRLSDCENENVVAFVEQTALVFLLYTAGKLMIDFDFDDDQIDLFAKAFSDKILSCKRSIIKMGS